MKSTKVIVFIEKQTAHLLCLGKTCDFDTMLNIILNMWDSIRYASQQPS